MEFNTEIDAKRVLDKFHGKMINGHYLKIAISDPSNKVCLYVCMYGWMG